MGADSHWSSALPWGTPSITSTSTTLRASSFSARRWAAVAPTLPAPTTVILFIMGSKATDSFPLSTTWSGGQVTPDGVPLDVRLGSERRGELGGAAGRVEIQPQPHRIGTFHALADTVARVVEHEAQARGGGIEPDPDFERAKDCVRTRRGEVTLPGCASPDEDRRAVSRSGRARRGRPRRAALRLRGQRGLATSPG